MSRTLLAAAPFTPVALSHVPELWMPPAGISGSPIDSIANAGTAGGSFTGTTTTRPAIGAINGVPCPDYDGSDDFLVSGINETDVMTGALWHFFAVTELDSWPASNSSPYTLAQILCHNRNSLTWGIGVQTTSLEPFQYDGSAWQKAATTYALTKKLIECWYDGSKIYGRVGNGGSVSTTVGSAILLGHVMYMGKNPNTALCIDGRIAEPICAKVVYTGADLANIRAYYARVYGVTV